MKILRINLKFLDLTCVSRFFFSFRNNISFTTLLQFTFIALFQSFVTVMINSVNIFLYMTPCAYTFLQFINYHSYLLSLFHFFKPLTQSQAIEKRYAFTNITYPIRFSFQNFYNIIYQIGRFTLCFSAYKNTKTWMTESRKTQL